MSGQRTLPLKGLTVAVTGSRRAKELAHLIISFGGIPYIAPTITIQVQSESTKPIQRFIKLALDGKIDFLLVMTGPGTQRIFDEATSLGLHAQLVDVLNKVTIIARSAKPLRVLSENGIRKVSRPNTETVKACFELLLNRDIVHKRVAVCWHGSNYPELTRELESSGAEIIELMTYKYSTQPDERGQGLLRTLGFDYVQPDTRKVRELIEDMAESRVHAITFTSPPAVDNLFLIAQQYGIVDMLRNALNDHVVTVAIGPTTRTAIERHGVPVRVVPDTYKIGPMLTALVTYVTKTQLLATITNN